MNITGSIVYIVDDDVSVCRALKLLLKQHGFRVETFTSAKEFLAFKYPKKPSCVVLDIRMPGGISGLALQEVMIVGDHQTATNSNHVAVMEATALGRLMVLKGALSPYSRRS